MIVSEGMPEPGAGAPVNGGCVGSEAVGAAAVWVADSSPSIGRVWRAAAKVSKF
jgi:hypothetical protein